MSKIVFPSAVSSKKNRFDVSSTHITTLDIGQIRPVNILPANEGDSFDVRMSEFSRLAPLAVPAFGTFRLKTQAFFVPLRVIWQDYMKYISRSVDNSTTLNVPRFSLGALIDFIFGFDTSTSAGWQSASSSDYVTIVATNSFDICWQTNSSTIAHKAVFTSKGRWLYNTLVSLGYEIPLTIDTNEWNLGSTSVLRNTYFSALPLLAYGRCLYDFIYPSRYVQQQGFGFLFEGLIDFDQPSVWLPKFFDLLFTPYSQDFFNSLWVSPNSPAVGQQQSFASTNIQNVDGSGVALKGIADDNTVLIQQGSNSYTTTASQNALRWLMKVSDYMMRNNLGGTRFNEWMKAHFNHVSKLELSYMSTFIKSWDDVINIDPVVSQTENTGARLGDMAATAKGSISDKFHYECDERGYLIFISQVLPVTECYQGLKPWCHDIESPFDFYTPDFDGMGFEGVPLKDVYFGGSAHSPIDIRTPNAVFGYSPRYTNRYKRQNHYLSGDFRFDSRNANLEAYHTLRNLAYGKSYGSTLSLNRDFLEVDNQYNRIFAADPTDANRKSLYDKIFTIFRFDVQKYSHMLSVSESIPFFDKSGEKVEMPYLGNNH